MRATMNAISQPAFARKGLEKARELDDDHVIDHQRSAPEQERGLDRIRRKPDDHLSNYRPSDLRRPIRSCVHSLIQHVIR